MGRDPQSVREMVRSYPWRRLGAWFIDITIVSLIVSLSFGDLLLAGDPRSAFLVAASSALIGSLYFLLFSNMNTTPGFALMRGSIRSRGSGRIAAAALFGAMLLPFGIVLMVLEPVYDVLGAFGAQVDV